MKRSLFICGFWFACLSMSIAQSISARSSAQDVFARQAFDVSFTIEGGGVEFTPPSFDPFQIVAGPFTSSSISIVNGRRSESKTYTYRLKQDKPGTYKIAPASLTTRTMKKRSNSLTIKVLEASKENAMQGNMIFLEDEFSDSIVYVGQQVYLDHYLYYGQLDIKGSALVGDFPRDRFLVNQVKDGTRLTRRQVMYEGKMLNQVQNSRLAIFPLRSGEIEIPDVNFQVDILNPNAPKRRGFFSIRNYESKVVSTPPFNLTVLPLPPDEPNSFTGNVGSLSVTAAIDSRQLKVGTEHFINIKLKGDGVSDQVFAPTWSQEELQVFDPKLLDENRKIENGKIIFTKTYQYLIIPERNDFTQIDVPVSFFDPSQGVYKTITATINDIVVLGSDQALTDATEKNLNALDSNEEPAFYKKYWFWGLALLAAGLGVLFLFKKRRGDKEVEITPEEAAKLVAQRQLLEAKQLLDNQETSKYWETLEKSLQIYVEDKLEIGTSSYSIAEITERWNAENFDPSLLEQWREMVRKINLARYAGQDISNMENLYKEAIDWIVACERN